MYVVGVEAADFASQIILRPAFRTFLNIITRSNDIKKQF